MSDLPDSYLPATSLPTKACANEETVKILRRGLRAFNALQNVTSTQTPACGIEVLSTARACSPPRNLIALIPRVRPGSARDQSQRSLNGNEAFRDIFRCEKSSDAARVIWDFPDIIERWWNVFRWCGAEGPCAAPSRGLALSWNQSHFSERGGANSLTGAPLSGHPPCRWLLI